MASGIDCGHVHMTATVTGTELHKTVLSISFKVDVPTGKVGGSLLFERQRRELPRGVWGHAPLENFEIRFSEMLFSPFSRQCLGLKNNQN